MIRGPVPFRKADVRTYAGGVERHSRWALGSIAAGIGAMVVLVAAASGLFSSPSADPGRVPLPTTNLVLGMECNAAERVGELAVDDGSSLTGNGTRILWPMGYVGRVRGDVVEVLDPAGAVVARTGDVISVGGGGSDDGFRMCPASATVIRPGRP